MATRPVLDLGRLVAVVGFSRLVLGSRELGPYRVLRLFLSLVLVRRVVLLGPG